MSVQNAERRAFITYSLAVAAGLYATVGGIVTLLGWVLAQPRLTDWFGNGITMKANPAICVIAAGSALLIFLALPSQKQLVRVLGAFVTLLAALTLFQHISGIDLHIDTFLFDEAPRAMATAAPGRMGVPASSSLTAIGLGLIFATFSSNLQRWTSVLATIALAIASLSLAGYLFGANQLFALSRITGIAFQAATMIAALCLAALLAVPQYGIAAALGRNDAGGLVFRRLFIPVILLSVVMGWLRIEGERAGLFDAAFGAAAVTLIEIVVFLGLLWTTVNAISRADSRARLAADALLEREERLRLATETGKVGVWDWDIRADVVSWTEAVYEMHCVEPGGFDGKVESFAALIHPDDREFVADRIEKALSGTPYEVEFRVPRPDGGVNWLFTNARVLSDAYGVHRMIGATINITERKLAEQKTATMAAIVDSSGDAIISKDLNGVITSWNKGAERIFGFRAEEVIGQNITMLMPPHRVPEEKTILERIRRGEYLEHYETERRRKDGKILDISLTVSPVKDASGKILGASKIARDITERRQTEVALRDREIMQRIVDAQEAERHRIARDLHDHLGQQLTALRLKLESIKSRVDRDDDLFNAVDETQIFAARIDQDINYLAWELRPTELDNLGLSDALRSFVREWSSTYSIQAEFHTSQSIGERPHPDIETNLYRIVQEGLHNILKHAAATNVNILLDDRDDRITLIMEDNGVGFEAGSTNGNTGGGLGLVGMQERAALLGGSMEIETEPGEGTTIYVRVPRRPAAPLQDPEGDASMI